MRNPALDIPEPNSHGESLLALGYTFYLYSDATDEGRDKTGLDGMRRLVHLCRGDLLKMNQGRGYRLSYTLPLIDKLDRHMPGFQSIIVTPMILLIKDSPKLLNLFD